MVWVRRKDDNGRGRRSKHPCYGVVEYDRKSLNRGIGVKYTGGMVTYFDHCNRDEISLIELDAMARELGLSTPNNYYIDEENNMISGLFVLSDDIDVMSMYDHVDDDGAVNVYVGDPSVNSVNSPNVVDSVEKSKAKGLLMDVEVVCDGVNGEEDEEYIPNEDSEDDDWEYEDSNNEVQDEFAIEVEMEGELDGSAHVDIDGDVVGSRMRDSDVDSDELRSIASLDESN
ncbi:hypothetical protein Dimus_029527 [Dionaea muscipula]